MYIFKYVCIEHNYRNTWYIDSNICTNCCGASIFHLSNLNKNPPTWGWVNHYFTFIPLYAGCIIHDMFWEFFDVDSPENTHFDRVSGESLLQLKVGLLERSHFNLGHFQLIPDVLTLRTGSTPPNLEIWCQ